MDVCMCARRTGKRAGSQDVCVYPCGILGGGRELGIVRLCVCLEVEIEVGGD